MKKLNSYKSPALKKLTKVFEGRRDMKLLYDGPWERYRLRFLAVNKKCYVCGERSEVVDHVTPHKGRYEFFWKVDNLLPLCKKDHDFITSKFDRYYRIGEIPFAKLQWISDNRDRDLSFRVKVVPFGDQQPEIDAERSKFLK